MEGKKIPAGLAIAVLLVVVAYVAWSQGSFGGGRMGAGPAGGIAVPGGLRTVGGKVSSISDTGFILTIPAFGQPASGGTSSLNVLVNQSTTLERLVQKDFAVMQKEQANYAAQFKKLHPTGSAGPTRSAQLPPEPFTHEKITLADIKNGDSVSVFTNIDIATTKEFTATRVYVLPAISQAPPVQGSRPSSLP